MEVPNLGLAEYENCCLVTVKEEGGKFMRKN